MTKDRRCPRCGGVLKFADACGRPSARQLIFKCVVCGHVELVIDTPKPISVGLRD